MSPPPSTQPPRGPERLVRYKSGEFIFFILFFLFYFFNAPQVVKLHAILLFHAPSSPGAGDTLRREAGVARTCRRAVRSLQDVTVSTSKPLTLWPVAFKYINSPLVYPGTAVLSASNTVPVQLEHVLSVRGRSGPRRPGAAASRTAQVFRGSADMGGNATG